ncbi:class I SAM-dependent methyltransferase [Leeia sp. TBRC 13508]|uniref:Class I SAM-dependent methyltransferase n=1 Tax=Leeia speluncae TaxID=2884804 RepID=A0ABS8D379_9NEIS|nr:class I SAM-dependent methyltransferase [Leeia speluncae]MCB6182630.1 class I SAM-dependent methyltransferase [Leeia speluncae]
MSKLAARFFRMVQSAPFYANLHAEAVAWVGVASGQQIWWDIGCGPGLITRQAARSGYATMGIDLSPDMLAEAAKMAKQDGLQIAYRNIDLQCVSDVLEKPSVLSAASLLAVLSDRPAGMRQLYNATREAGKLVIIETTAEMTIPHAWRWLMKNGWKNGNWILMLWAISRRKMIPVDVPALLPAGCQFDYLPLLDGMVGAWQIKKR